jgi:hypothetical protein
VDVDTALGLGQLGLGRVDNGDVLGAAALGVLHSGAGARARGTVLADLAVRHVVVEFEVAVKLNRDVELDDGELLGDALGVAAEGRRVPLVRAADTRDGLAAKGPAGDIAPSASIPALPALEVEVVVAVELADGQVQPVKAALLLVIALVVDVLGAVEGRGAAETAKSGKGPAKGGSQRQKRGGLHVS